jgi:hypothetical protein
VRALPEIMACSEVIVEWRPNFINALALRTLPGVQTNPVKSRNFLK